MKTFFAAVCLMVSLFANAQKTQPKLEHIDNDIMNKQINSSMKQLDSMNARINDGYKQTMHTMDSVNNHLQQEQNDKNLDEFVRMQKENDEKAKKHHGYGSGVAYFFSAYLFLDGCEKERRRANYLFARVFNFLYLK